MRVGVAERDNRMTGDRAGITLMRGINLLCSERNHHHGREQWAEDSENTAKPSAKIGSGIVAS